MKSFKPHSRQMDEREKLRKFRELDDAFAQALRELDKTSRKPEPEEAAPAQDEPHESDPHGFENRLRALMADYQQSDTSVDTLLRTMLKLGKIA
ncbi:MULTISPECIES: hypothetical protein [unclassified Halomonas]|uniref:hypothetical protein n=1 Tax=unclassified Halomonas TaxID=2609666 RepID=UPI001EF589ED|nr:MULTISPECIES: hypothetical protein [unclassified Halomonas]MCP1340942.1 hypothetical protein [Halomonas sp. FL8]MCP1362513.1 hypothetical protein [Halomonas sp. BBD45]